MRGNANQINGRTLLYLSMHTYWTLNHTTTSPQELHSSTKELTTQLWFGQISLSLGHSAALSVLSLVLSSVRPLVNGSDVREVLDFMVPLLWCCVDTIDGEQAKDRGENVYSVCYWFVQVGRSVSLVLSLIQLQL